MGVSLMSTLFVLPPAILVVELFRRTKPFMSEQEQEDLDGQLVKIAIPKIRNLVAVSKYRVSRFLLQKRIRNQHLK